MNKSDMIRADVDAIKAMTAQTEEHCAIQVGETVRRVYRNVSLEVKSVEWDGDGWLIGLSDGTTEHSENLEWVDA